MDYEQKYKEALERAREKYAMFSDMQAGYVLQDVFPELAESEDERIRKGLIEDYKKFNPMDEYLDGVPFSHVVDWLEKQKSAELFEIEHGKYYYCIKDYYAGGNKRASKGDVVQALRGMSMMALDERANEYFMPVNSIKQKPVDSLSAQEAMDIAVAKCFEQCEQKPIECSNSDFQTLRNCIDAIRLAKEGKTIKADYDEMIAWLENQGKPTDKVEPKFKVGDWVVDDEDGTIFQIVKVLDNTYTYKTNEGSEYSCTHYSLEDDARLWTIQDAKDGDVLACLNDAGDRDVVFIFKNINSDEGWVFCFCASDANGCFCTNNDYVGNSNSTNISPATKEQRDLLFQKMKEAGYEWDAKKKELKKIEQKPYAQREECFDCQFNNGMLSMQSRMTKDAVVEKAIKFLNDNLDRYDESIGLTKDEFVIEIYKHINTEP